MPFLVTKPKTVSPSLPKKKKKKYTRAWYAIKSNEKEDLESFLGYAIPQLKWSPAPTHGTPTRHRGQNSVANQPNRAVCDESESTSHVREVYYCPSVHHYEVDTSIHNHTDETFSTEQNLHTIAQEAYMINCESMNYELKEDESDFFNADTISQSSTKPDECWDHPRKNTGGNKPRFYHMITRGGSKHLSWTSTTNVPASME